MSLLFGTGNYVYVPYAAGLDTLTTELTISCWINLTTAGSMQMFINRQVAAAPMACSYSSRLSLLDRKSSALVPVAIYRTAA